MVIRFLRTVTVPLLLAGCLVLAGAVADRVYSGQLLTALLAGAAAGSVLISLACLRLPAWLVAPISVLGLAGYLAYVLPLTAQRAGIDAGLVDLADESLRNGIPRLLAALVPVEPQPDTVALPIVATWLAGLAATELAGRARRTLVGLIPPVLLYSGAVWLVGPGQGVAIGHTLAFAGLAVAALAVTGRVRTPESGIDSSTRTALRLRSATAAAVGLALVVGLTLASAPTIAARVGATPFDPRSLVEPPDTDALDENPLIRLSGWALAPDQKLLTATVDADSRIRLAVMSDYDGVTWRVGATYRPAGRVLPEQPADVAQRPVTQQIVIDGLSGKLLPAVATPRRVDGVRIAYDTSTGTLIRPEGLHEGLSYRVASRQDTPDVNMLPGADVPTGSQMARYLALGAGVPESMTRLAEKLGADNGAPYQRALAIEQFLAEHYRLDPQAPSGHAYPNLDFFLFEATGAGGGRGTSEQFAAAFAVLARLLNLPSRVVVGFAAPAGTTEITAGDALAWPEVFFTGLGWVSFHPLPELDGKPRPLEEEFRPKPQESSLPPPSDAPIPTLEPTEAAPTAGPSEGLVAAGGSSTAIVAGAGGGLLVLVLAAFVIVVLTSRAALRRRRLETGTAVDRVNGAWLEVSDALRLAGRPPGDHLTAAEIVEHAATAAVPPAGAALRLAAPGIDGLAESVNRSTFDSHGIDYDDAETARAEAEAYIAELKARRPWHRRLLWTLHPGPLRWHRRR